MNVAWLMSGRPGAGEALLVILILLIFFGAKRLPELARSMGRSINEFKKGKAEGAEEADDDTKTDEPDTK